MTTVRMATKADTAEVATIIAEVRREAEPVGLAEALDAAGVERWMTRLGEAGALLVADDGRQIVGFAVLEPSAAHPGECTFGAWVRALNRRQGHATALAEEAIAFARQRGYRRILARLPEGNEPALSFLSAVGALATLGSPGITYELPMEAEPS